MDYAALIVAGVTVVFSAGTYVAAVRQNKRDTNGIGKKLREHCELDERRWRSLLAFLFTEPDATQRARRLAEILREG